MTTQYLQDIFRQSIGRKKPEIIKKTLINENLCKECGIKMIEQNSQFICESCGFTEQCLRQSNEFCISSDADHNTSSKAASSFKIVSAKTDPNSRRASNKLNISLMCSTSNYTNQRFRENLLLLKKKNTAFYKKTNHKIRDDVLYLTVKKYEHLIGKFSLIRRGNQRLALLGECLSRASIETNIPRPLKEIALFMDIEEKRIRASHELERYGIKFKFDQFELIGDYIRQTMNKLEIDISYYDFAFDLIKRAEDRKIHILRSNKDTTKVSGAIYTITQRVKKYNHITPSSIEKIMYSSTTTFINYYKKIICAYNHIFKDIFVKHKISMPIGWALDSSSSSD